MATQALWRRLGRWIMTVGTLVVVACLLWSAGAFAQSSSSPTGPIAGTDLLAPGQSEPTTAMPTISTSRVYDSVHGFFGSSFAQTGVRDLVSPTVTLGNGRLYVASAYQRAVFMYDADTLAPVSVNGGVFGQTGAGQLDSPQGIAFYKGEVFVSDPAANEEVGRIAVYDADGNFKRSLPGRYTGIDVAWGEVWGRAADSPATDPVTDPESPAHDFTDGMAPINWPLRLEARDVQTGALRAIVPFNDSPCYWDELLILCVPYLHWPRTQDVAVAPDVGAVFNGFASVMRNSLYSSLSVWSGYSVGTIPTYQGISEACYGGTNHTNTGEPMGSTEVWGAKTLMTVDDCQPVTGSRDSMVGQIPLEVDSRTGLIGFDLVQAWWYPQDRTTNVYRDIAFRHHKAEIVWMGGNLPDLSSWMRGTQCVRYVVSDGDWYIVGNKGEHWYKVAAGFSGTVQLYLDNNPTPLTLAAGSTSPTQPTGTLCVDTAAPWGAGSSLPSGTHQLKMTATVNGAPISRTNPTLHTDNTPPTGTLDGGLPAATNAAVDASGTIADTHAGPGTWNLQVNGPGTGGNYQTVCTATAPSPGTNKWGCRWNTPAYPEGTYQVRALLADGVRTTHGGPNTAPVGSATVIVDRTAPAIDNMAPDINEVMREQVNTDQTSVDWTHADNLGGSGVQSTAVEVNAAPDGTDSGAWEPIGSSSASSEGHLLWDLTSRDGGLYRLRARSCDRAGNCGQRQWQAVVSVHSKRFRRCVTTASDHCYAVQDMGQGTSTGYSGYGLKGNLRAPSPVGHQARDEFTVNYFNLGTTRTLQVGLSTPSPPHKRSHNEACGRVTNGPTDSWWYYVELVTPRGGVIDCFARATAGLTRSYEVIITNPDADSYYAQGKVNGVARPIRRLGPGRTFWLGRTGADGPQAGGEVTNRTREMAGYFTSVMVNAHDTGYQDPADVSFERDPNAGFVIFGPGSAFCVSDKRRASSHGCTVGYPNP